MLSGTHRHEDHAGYAAAMPDDLLEQEMHLIKDMGANFIRLAHYQQSRRVLDLCDRLGLLVWEEIPWCRGGIGNEIFQEMGRRTLRNMIAQHHNHPSVILWGLGNENDWPTEYPEINQEKIRAYLTELRDLAHQLDPSRMTTIRRCDFCSRHPRRLLPLHLGGLVQRNLSGISEVARDSERTRQASLPCRVGSRQPCWPPFRGPR